MAEEARIFGMADAADNRSRLDVRSEDVAGLSADQARAVGNIAVSPFLVQPLCAPAGAGKTHSLKALRVGAARGHKQLLVLAPTGKTVDEAIRRRASRADRRQSAAAARRGRAEPGCADRASRRRGLDGGHP